VLYLDSCVLVKRYVQETGSEVVEARLEKGEKLFTSPLTYFEVLAAFGRKLHDGEMQPVGFETARDRFLGDWVSFNLVNMDTRIMASLPDLVVKYSLKGADWVHLTGALWCRDTFRLVPAFAQGQPGFEFAVVDKQLARVAVQCGLAVFNPEASA